MSTLAFKSIDKTKQRLSLKAERKWAQSFRIKEPATGNFCNDLNGLSMLIRVNHSVDDQTCFAFWWLYSMHDARLLIGFVHDVLCLEAHEVIFGPHIKLFYDIDMPLSRADLAQMTRHYEESSGEDGLSVDDVSRHLAHLYFDATLASLSDRGNSREQLEEEASFMYTTRNRPTSAGYKLSIHVITNIVCSTEQCRAVVEDVKSNILHDPDSYGLDYPVPGFDNIVGAIDSQPYHRLGSLAIVGGRKLVDGVEYINRTQQAFQMPGETPFVTVIDPCSSRVAFGQYDISPSYQYDPQATVSKEFVDLVYRYVHKIPDFDHSDWDLDAASYKGCTAILRRMQPSRCSMCERQHDVDNTLMIVFNEQRRTGAWKCIRARDIKSEIFYSEELLDPVDPDDLEQFSKRVNPRQKRGLSHVPQPYSSGQASACIPMPKFDTTDSTEPLIVEEAYVEEEEMEAPVPAELTVELTDSTTPLVLEEPYEEKPVVYTEPTPEDSPSDSESDGEPFISIMGEPCHNESAIGQEDNLIKSPHESIRDDDSEDEFQLEAGYKSDPEGSGRADPAQDDELDYSSAEEEYQLEAGYESDGLSAVKKKSTPARKIKYKYDLTATGVLYFSRERFTL